MIPELTKAGGNTCAALGIIAWNEEAAIGSTLESLFEQSLFAELSRRNQVCEIICVANGCTDRTAEIAAGIFQEQARQHPHATAFTCRVVNLPERGKVNAWNQFVHSLSAREARFLFLMDADILIHGQETLWKMLAALEEDSQASVTVDRPCKDILFKGRKSPWERLSLASSQMTGSGQAQLCGQLYCIRAEVARNIYLPKDLAACEDGFIKALVCTDFLAHPVRAERIRVAENAGHTFEAYTSPAAVFKNQKRQMIGQTIVHILVDDFLKGLPAAQRARLAETLKEKEAADPLWLKRLIAEHLRRTRFFWRLYPGLLGHCFRRLANLGAARRVLCLPAAAAGFVLALLSSFMAQQTLKRGCTDYWPQARRAGLKPVQLQSPPSGELTAIQLNKE